MKKEHDNANLLVDKKRKIRTKAKSRMKEKKKTLWCNENDHIIQKNSKRKKKR